MTERSFDAAAHARAMRSAGYWTDRSFDACLMAAVAATPGKTAIVADRQDRPDGVRQRFTYAELADLVARAAAGLRDLGVVPGDIVAVQLPNWWEFVVLALACGRIGAVINPLMPIFRERELRYMLGFAEAKLLVVPRVFRGFEHRAMAMALKAELPALRAVVVVDGDGPEAFDRCILGRDGRIGPESGLPEPVPPQPVLPDPDSLAVLMYTSGTTGSPKGAMHSTNTLMTCADNLARRFGLGADDVLLVCSPLGHMTGYAAGAILGLRLGATIVLQDVWEARRGVALMAAEGVTHSGGPTPFLSDLLEAVAAGAPRPAALRSFLCAGAPIPPVLVERALHDLGLTVCSVWGMTEALAGTMTEPAEASRKSATTDGRALDGMEVRVVEDGVIVRLLPVGNTGRLQVRGAQMFLGYYKRPDLSPFDADGWFETGDLARLDAEGYIRIDGRTKDVVIRGGENVPVAEIENLLYRHPAVAAAAIVGYPDARLGERCCAFLVLRPGRTFDLAGLRAFMAECQVAKQYWPERVAILDELPRTPTGKIQKFLLREQARCFGDA